MKTHPKKHFGQHFLSDAKYINKIVQILNLKQEDHLVEIGPGRGALTEQLIDKCKAFYAVELDRDMVDHLNQQFPKLNVLHADATRFDFTELVGEQPLRIVGNLPYNVSTPILFHLLKEADSIQDMLFMLQKEVVDRMCSAPGSKQYGRLSVMVQYRCATDHCFEVPASAFSPPPKVESAVVRLTPYKQNQCPYPEVPVSALQTLVTQAFTMRRKTLRNALKGYIVEEQMLKLDIDPKARPETLSVEQFAKLTLTWLDTQKNDS